MVTNYYNAHSGAGPIRREPAPYAAPPEKPEKSEKPVVQPTQSVASREPDRDTTLLAGLLFFLLVSGCRDTWLLLALGYLLLF